MASRNSTLPSLDPNAMLGGSSSRLWNVPARSAMLLVTIYKCGISCRVGLGLDGKRIMSASMEPKGSGNSISISIKSTSLYRLSITRGGVRNFIKGDIRQRDSALFTMQGSLIAAKGRYANA